MNERHFAHQVRQHLNQGLNRLDGTVTERLAIARRAALAHQRVARRQSILAGMGINLHFDAIDPKQIVLALLIALMAAGFTVWHSQENIAELEEVDSALLADDLPLSAYLDKGFDAWLKDSSQN